MRRFTIHLAVAATALVLFAVPSGAATTAPIGKPVVLIGTEGGFVAPGYIKSALPALVGYANGAVLTRVDNTRRPDVRVMRLHTLTANRLRLHARALAAAANTPSDGWGTPGVADVPNTYVQINYPGLRRSVSVFALSFTENGDVTSAQAAARKTLQRAIGSLTAAAKAAPARAWTPVRYEAWTMTQLVVQAGLGMANPASVFCESMGGTLSIVDAADGQVGYCTLPDGTRAEEWAYYRATAPTLNTWPEAAMAPTAACTIIKATTFEKAWQRKNNTGMWVMPSGQAAAFTFRPVLPGEAPCARPSMFD